MTPEQKAALAARLAEPDAAALVVESKIDEVIALLSQRIAVLDADGQPEIEWADLTTEWVHGFLLATLEWAIIEFVAEGEFFGPMQQLDDATKLQLRVLCRSFRSLIMQRQTIQMTDPMKREAALGALAMLGYAQLLTPASEAAIIGKTRQAKMRSWADENFVPTPRDIGLALGGQP